MDPQGLAFQFGIGGFVLARNLAGVTQEESLRAPRPAGNSLNWIVGHIVRARNQALGILGATPMFDDADFSLLASIVFHEAYHLGQTGISRRLLGKEGALLAPGEEGH